MIQCDTAQTRTLTSLRTGAAFVHCRVRSLVVPVVQPAGNNTCSAAKRAIIVSGLNLAVVQHCGSTSVVRGGAQT